MNRVYRGQREPEGQTRVTVTDDKSTRALAERLSISGMPALGFEWWHRGLAPLNLAFSLVSDVAAMNHKQGWSEAADGMAKSLALRFMDDVVVNLPHAGWELTELEILKLIGAMQDARAVDFSKAAVKARSTRPTN
jgi:Family of unknown function (DUF6166)